MLQVVDCSLDPHLTVACPISPTAPLQVGLGAGFIVSLRLSLQVIVLSATLCSLRTDLPAQTSERAVGLLLAQCRSEPKLEARTNVRSGFGGNGSGHGQRGSAFGCMQMEDSLGRERSGGLEKQHALVVHVDSAAVFHKVKRIQRRCDVRDRT